MYNFEYQTQGTISYLVYKVGENDEIDTMSLGMVTNNKIPGLVSTIFTQMDADKFLKFNITSRISVKQFFSGTVNKKRLMGVFSGIANAMISAEDYMIDINSIILDLDYIYTDVSTCETSLICLPIISEDVKSVDFKAFFKNIMFSTQFDQTENCDHVAKIINYLNGASAFSFYEFKNLLDGINGVSIPATPVATPAQVAPATPVAPPVAAPIAPAPVAPVAPPVAPAPVAPTPAVRPAAPAQVAPATSAPAKQPAPAKPVAPGGMNIPNQPAKKGGAAPMPMPARQGQSATSAATSDIPEGEEISLMYLLQHYNSENAALYKAQKEAKKAKKGKKDAPAPVVSAPNAPAAPNAKVPGAPAPNFAPPMPNAPMQNPASPVAPPMSTPAPAPVPAMVAAPTTNAPAPVAPMPVQSAPMASNMNFGDTTVLGGGGANNYGDTTVLSAVQNTVSVATPYLIRVKNNEKIAINKPLTRIGKERSYVDYFIADNTAISRSHANIILRDGECFIVDTNSTNHTFVNGVMIQSNVETKLNDGDSVKLANEAFDFKIM